MQLTQKALIGKTIVELDTQEYLMLKLLMCPESQIQEVWVRLWATIADYEELHFFCKDFMPTAIMRLYRYGLLDELMPLIRGNRHFMRGLPKFIWSKNQLLLREARQISVFFANAGIDFSFAKGVGRMLELGGSELYRISRDIDVLVPWDQFDQAIDLLLKHNWEFKEPTSEGAMSIGRINAFALYHPIHRIDIDLHRSLFHDAGNDCFPLMNEIWGRAKKSELSKHLFILSRRDQLLAAVENAFNLFNWETSQFCKYIYDVAKILQQMNDEELSALPHDLEIAKQSPQFFQILRILEALEVDLPWQSLSKYPDMADLKNSLANYHLHHQNKIAIQGISALMLVGWCGTIKLFWSAIQKNPLHMAAYAYLITKIGRVVSRLLKGTYCSVFSIKQKEGPSIFKKRIRWYLFG